MEPLKNSKIILFTLMLLCFACNIPGQYPGETSEFLYGPAQVQSFGYFASDDHEPEIKDHVNTSFMDAGDWDSLKKTVADHLHAVISVQWVFFDSAMKLKPTWRDDWRAFSARLMPYQGSLIAFYLMDEPYGAAKRAKISRDDMRKQLEKIIPVIKADYPTVATSTIFGDSEVLSNFKIPKGIDWVGIDCYGGFDFCDGMPVVYYIDLLKRHMTHDQRLIVVPGTMTFQKKHPTAGDQRDAIGWMKQYYDYALRNKEVVAIWNFLWYTIPDAGSIDTGARDSALIRHANADLMHLVEFQGRPEFDADLYRSLSGVIGSDDHAYRDWIGKGVKQGERSSYAFDVAFYLRANPDFANSDFSDYDGALDHWLVHGENEARAMSAEFDPGFYLSIYPDLAAAFGDNGYKAAINHWYHQGNVEGRRTSPAFDISYLVQTNAQAARALATLGGANRFQAAWKYWLTYGRDHGLRPSLEFDPSFYLGAHPEIAGANDPQRFQKAIEDWLLNGLDQGCAGSADFDPAYYLQANPDVAAAYGATNYRGGLIHWLVFGKKEGRKGAPATATVPSPPTKPFPGPRPTPVQTPKAPRLPWGGRADETPITPRPSNGHHGPSSSRFPGVTRSSA